MSKITNVILTVSLEEMTGDQCDAVDGINNLVESGRLNLVSGVQAQGKQVEAAVFIGAYNYLDMNEFKVAIKAADWKNPGGVSLFVKEEDWPRFIEVPVIGG